MIWLTVLRNLPWRLIAVVMVLAGLFTAGWVNGRNHNERQWQARIAAQQRHVEQVQSKQAAAAAQVVTQYVDRVRVVHEAGATITKEIPVYVSRDACPLPGGFRVLHDAAATGQPPDPTRPVDASPVAVDDAAETVTGNYEACRANAEQLTALQDWVRQMRAVSR